jgi:hypothetical protein
MGEGHVEQEGCEIILGKRGIMGGGVGEENG